MTIGSQVYRDDYIGNDAADTYDYSFKIFDKTHLLVIVRDPANDVETELVVDVDYTVADVGEENGGTITLIDTGSSWNGTGANLETSWALAILLNPALEQQTDLRNQGAYAPETVEDQLDKLYQIDLKQERDIAQSVKLPKSFDGVDTEVPALVASAVLAMNATKTAFEWVLQAGTLAVSAFGQSLLNAANAAAARALLLINTTWDTIITTINFAAKGDLLVGTGANAASIQSVGTDGYPLVPVSGATRGLAYLPPSLGGGLVGGYLAWTVAANALTIAVKTWTGNDPSAAEPVFVPVRNSAAGTGTITYRKLTAALSLVISSGSAMGFTNNVAGRLWAVVFDDAGTLRLGAINCLSGTNIYPLTAWAIASSTAEGGVGGADSAQVFYTGVAVAAKPYTVLGYATWETALAAAGTWSAAPDRVELYRPGVPLPGQIIQEVSNTDSAYAGGTTLLPIDDTIPQITEGDQFMSQAVAPTSKASVLVIEHQGYYSHTSVNGLICAALFQDATANALAAQVQTRNETANRRCSVNLRHRMKAETTATTTFKLRAGTSSAGTTGFNGASAAREFGGVLASYLAVREYQA